jgi:2-keto-3-deoxy-L-rhamnonate aldolase RhmA
MPHRRFDRDARRNEREDEPTMRDNPVKTRLAAGGRAFGAMIFECFTPGMPQICRNAGAEFVLFDMEHSGLSFETLKVQFALCRGLDIVPMVRVPRGEYHFIARALDLGAMGVMVPMVATAAEAEHIVACTRYPPAGRRGAAFGFAHDDYQGGDVTAKIAALHARTMVIPQIETAEGLASVEAIAAVPGVDALWLGHFDLTNFMGIPGAFRHPEYLAAVRRIAAACEAHGKAAAFLAADDSWAREYRGYGFRLFAFGVDHAKLQAALAHGLAVLRE